MNRFNYDEYEIWLVETNKGFSKVKLLRGLKRVGVKMKKVIS